MAGDIRFLVYTRQLDIVAHISLDHIIFYVFIHLAILAKKM